MHPLLCQLRLMEELEVQTLWLALIPIISHTTVSILRHLTQI